MFLEGGTVISTMAMCLGKIRGVLLDLSGTLHIENAPTSPAITALRRWDVPVIRSLVGGANKTLCAVCVCGLYGCKMGSEQRPWE